MTPRDNRPPEEDRKRDKRTVFTELANFLSLVGFFYGRLDETLPFREAVKEQFDKPVPRYRTPLENNLLACFGGIAFLLFLLQIMTGLLLLMYYRPTVAEAHASIVQIMNKAPYGWLFRGIHHWGANLLMVMLVLHMLRVYLTGAFRPPREMTWFNGVFLFFLTGMMGFTGRILTWDQSSYWATAVGTENLSAIPVVGETAKYLLRAGGAVGQLALTRFFALHVVVIPGLMFLFLALHFLMIRRQGISEPL